MGRSLQILLARLVRCQPPPLGVQGLLRHALEHLLDGSRVADEAHRHLQALRRDVADAAPGSSIPFLLIQVECRFYQNTFLPAERHTK